MASQVKFRRIHGRIVPIAIGTGAAAGAVSVAKRGGALSPRKGDKPATASLQFAAGLALQAASGLVAATPFRSARGAVASIGGSLGLDAVSTGLFARAADNSSKSRTGKIKKFAQYHAVGAAVGWGTFGGGLLAQPAVRSTALKWARKILTRGRG